VSDGIRQWGLRYRAHNKVLRWAVVVARAQYGPEHPSPPLPLVISPHGRGVRARTNANLWETEKMVPIESSDQLGDGAPAPPRNSVVGIAIHLGEPPARPRWAISPSPGPEPSIAFEGVGWPPMTPYFHSWW
jgi:hypothetical protein